MKIKTKELIGFKPVTLEITFESLEEIEDLLARINVAAPVINDSKSGKYEANNKYNYALYQELKKIHDRSK